MYVVKFSFENYITLYALLLALIFVPDKSLTQIVGLITNEGSDPLPYATISYENGLKGTTSNLEGKYQLSLPAGRYDLSFRYLGYKTIRKSIDYDGVYLELNVRLPEESIELAEVTIAADGEDPAYAVMRKVIENRDKNKKSIHTYEGDLYIKGIIRTADVPETFMGQDIGDMEGILDSNRQGIIYLSESRSTVYFRQPESFKEIMHYSKTAGNDNGFSFNQYAGANFNFYYENLTFDRTLISPLNDAAFSHYRFKLEGFYLDDKGRQINKISVIPKDDVRPLFSGTIYIVEDEWVLSSVDLAFTGKAIKNKFFNKIRIRQIMEYSENSGLWYTQNQIIDFDTDFFGFKFFGTFSYFFFDIKLNADLPENIFGAEIFTMDDGAMEQPLTFWDSIRPIPLTMDEENDYIKKDSLKELKESKVYLDSLDRKANRIKITSLMFGFQNNDTYNKRYITMGSPVGQFRFNPVEGFAIGTRLNVRKYSQDDNRRLTMESTIRYGFSDKQWKADLNGSYRFSRKNLSFLSFSGGREYFQFDQREAISFGLNTWSSLFYKKNRAKIFDKKYIKLGVQSEIANGLYGWVSLSRENRSPLYNLTDYSLFNKDRSYEPNNFYSDDGGEEAFDAHKAVLIGVNLRWRPGQKYLTYPKFKIRISSEWPTFSMLYEKAVGNGAEYVKFDKMVLRMRDAYIDMKTYGFSTLNLEYGHFFNTERLEFMDHFHFLSNETTTTYFDRYVYAFKNMPFYDFSTADDFVMANFEHHFDGYIMDRIPLLQDSGLTLVAGFGGLWTSKNYYEWNLGIEGFSLGGLEFLRIDFVQSYTDEGFFDRGVKIGLTRFFNQVVD